MLSAAEREWVCADGILHMGHVIDAFPYAFTDAEGHIVGIFVDFFMRIAFWIGCTKGVVMDRFKAQRSNNTDPLLQGRVASREIFAVVGGTSQELDDDEKHSSSDPVAVFKPGMYMRQPVISASTQIFQYIGYTIIAAIAVVISILVAMILTYLLDRLLKKMRVSTFYRVIITCINFLLTGSICLFVAFHAAIFTGNAISNYVTPSTWANILPQLNDGSKRLILNNGGWGYSHDQLVKITGTDRPPVFANSTLEALQKACDDPTLVALGLDVELDTLLYLLRLQGKKCPLVRIDMGSVKTGHKEFDAEIRAGYIMSFVMPLGVPQVILDKIDSEIRTTLSPERIRSQAARRYGSVNREVEEDRSPTFFPYELSQAIPVIIALIVLLIVSLFIFGSTEIPKRNKVSSLRNFINKAHKRLQTQFEFLTFLLAADESEDTTGSSLIDPPPPPPPPPVPRNSRVADNDDVFLAPPSSIATNPTIPVPVPPPIAPHYDTVPDVDTVSPSSPSSSHRPSSLYVDDV